MADTATLTLRADISELQRKLRSIPDEAAGSAKQMAVTLEREFKRASAAAEAAAKASSAANTRAAAETERANAKMAAEMERAAARLQDYAAAGDPVAELTLKYQRQIAEIESLGKVTGDTQATQVALTRATEEHTRQLGIMAAKAKSAADAEQAAVVAATTAANAKLAADAERTAAEVARSNARLQEYLAAGDPVAELTLKFNRQAAEIERIAKVTGDAEGAQKALAKASSEYADELAKIQFPDDPGPEKAANANWKLNQQVLSLRKNVGDFANSLLAGQSPFTVLAQQGPQVLEIFAEADDVTELLQSSFGNLIGKAKAAGGTLAIAAVAAAAIATAYSLAANAADENADGNNRLAASFRKLTENVDSSTASLNAQNAAMARLQDAANTRREDLLVEIGALDEHAVAAERDKRAVADATRADMLAITARKAKMVADLQTAESAWAASEAGSNQRKETARVTQELREGIKAENEKIKTAQANYDQQIEDIDNLRLIRQAKAAEAEATKSGTVARKDSSKADKDAERAARDLAKAYEDVAEVVAGVVEANATDERKLEIAAAERIKVLTEIADKYADQPDLVKRAADAEFAVREQLRADVAELRTAEAEEFEKAKQTLHERDLARAKELADQESRLQAQRMANVQALSTFASGVSDLLAQRSEANAKRDRELAVRQFKASKAAAIAEATINGAVAITRALASLGPIAGALATAGISASTAAQIGVIASQKPAFDRGGMIQGGRMADQVPINALPGEAVLSRGAVRAVGGQAGVDRLNRGESGAPQVVVVETYKHFGRFVHDELGRAGVLQRAMLAGRPVGALGY